MKASQLGNIKELELESYLQVKHSSWLSKFADVESLYMISERQRADNPAVQAACIIQAEVQKGGVLDHDLEVARERFRKNKL